VSCFAVSLKSTDGNDFAVSLFAQADGNASRTASPDLTAVGELTARFAVSQPSG